MYTGLSAAMLAALAGPGPDKVESYGELWDITTGNQLGTVELTGFRVTLDSAASIRGAVTATVPDVEGLLPTVASSGHDREFGENNFGTGVFGNYKRRWLKGLIVPLKTELRVFWRGLVPGTDTWETVPMGRYILSDPTFNDDPAGDTVTLNGLDVSSLIAAAKWSEPFHIKKGTNVATALQFLLWSRLPGLVIHVPTTTATTPKIIYAPGYSQGSDPWQDASRLAASAGWILYINRNGEAVAEAPADPSAGGTAVWSLRDDGTAIKFAQTPNAADVVNTVIVYAESSGEKPVYAVVQDTDGPYGVNTLGRVIATEYRASDIKDQAQAQNAGIALLRQKTTITETVDIASFPAPHLDPSDLVSVWSDVLEMEDDLFAISQVVFDADPATATTVRVSRRI